jgi:DNA-3-methyladenine glycosylase I
VSDLFLGDDGLPRCGWVAGAPEFVAYHDDEWGRPVHDDHRLFEKLSLEAFQSGLSWRTILVKRENFRSAFAGFRIEEVAGFGDADVERLLGDAGIVRHRGKIEAVIDNARRAAELREQAGEGALDALVWRHRPEALPEPELRATSPESVALSRELKRRGWRFVGPTTVYAFMQAMGLVNDHAVGCAFRDVCPPGPTSGRAAGAVVVVCDVRLGRRPGGRRRSPR